MTTFIYNEAYKSGGHWHIAKNLRITDVPEKREDKTREVIKWHGVPKSQAIEGARYYTPRNYNYSGDDNGCNRCGKIESEHRQGYRYGSHDFEEPRVYPILGDVTATIITPAHRIAKADGACGQVGGITVVNIRERDVSRIMTAKKNIGKHITIEHVVVRLMVEDTFVPEPLCGHCFKLLP